jgi:two-component system, NarL family, sensor kinase
VQECVNNVVRHSGARAASVTLRRDAGWLRLRVADDGRGFTPEAVAHSRERGGGFGLLNLQDLTRLLGGQLEITTAPGEGTVVTVNIPTPDSLERKL